MDDSGALDPRIPRMSSETVTRQIRVSVEAEYSAEHSNPLISQWFFLYTIQIANESEDTVQLISRHWLIRDAGDHTEEVRGLGVVGKQPVLEPGDAFEYTSGCPLTTPWGTMQGTYQMTTADGEQFNVDIAPFDLRAPYTIH